VETTVAAEPAIPESATSEPAIPEPVSRKQTPAQDLSEPSAPEASTTEPCAHCGAALAHDQRYCLECGAPRTFLSGLQQLDGLRAAAAGYPAPSTIPPHPAMVAPYGPSPYPYPPGAPVGGGTRWSGPASLIAGVGVLLLAMGVGVLIGRSGSNSTKGAAAPPAQVIRVEPSGSAGAAEAGESESSAKAPSGKHSSKKSAPKSESSGKAGSGTGVGESIQKPAPPSVLKNEKSKRGGSFEQKSKNLPNVISTG
jgi:hypothetical protein